MVGEVLRRLGLAAAQLAQQGLYGPLPYGHQYDNASPLLSYGSMALSRRPTAPGPGELVRTCCGDMFCGMGSS